MRRIIQRIFFGRKRTHYRKRNYNNVIFDNQRLINDMQSQMNNLMKHLKLERIGRSNLVGDEKDAKKFDKQWN